VLIRLKLVLPDFMLRRGVIRWRFRSSGAEATGRT
jgi:hypothetical protein